MIQDNIAKFLSDTQDLLIRLDKKMDSLSNQLAKVEKILVENGSGTSGELENSNEDDFIVSIESC